MEQVKTLYTSTMVTTHLELDLVLNPALECVLVTSVYPEFNAVLDTVH